MINIIQNKCNYLKKQPKIKQIQIRSLLKSIKRKRKGKKGEILDEEESNEDQIIEDENDELIIDKVTQKFIETFAKIKYKHPDIYQSKEIFQEEDFDEPGIRDQNQEISHMVISKGKESKMNNRNQKSMNQILT